MGGAAHTTMSNRVFSSNRDKMGATIGGALLGGLGGGLAGLTTNALGSIYGELTGPSVNYSDPLSNTPLPPSYDRVKDPTTAEYLIPGLAGYRKGRFDQEDRRDGMSSPMARSKFREALLAQAANTRREAMTPGHPYRDALLAEAEVAENYAKMYQSSK
jgi:hypothetical protein